MFYFQDSVVLHQMVCNYSRLKHVSGHRIANQRCSFIINVILKVFTEESPKIVPFTKKRTGKDTHLCVCLSVMTLFTFPLPFFACRLAGMVG